MRPELEGKAALVTGAASGIGHAVAIAFVRAGARVALVDRREQPLAAAREELVAIGGSDGAVSLHVADVSDAASVEQAVREAIAAHGRLDVACNNAGVTQPSRLTHETAEETYDRVMAVNVKGVWLGMRAELRHMLAAGSGAIVNTASIAGLKGTPGMSPYSAAKHAVIGLTRTAALEYATRGVRVNAVAPGTVDTPMVAEFVRQSGGDDRVMNEVLSGHPMGRGGQAAEIAAAVLWLASAQASFVTGHILAVDGGYTAG